MKLLTSHKLCDTCGSTLEFEMPSGFCPGCLLNTVLETERETTAAPGSHIDDYELLNEVARGGMGIVYRARQRTPSRIVALKMILPARLHSLGAINRFRTEAEAAASLDHECVLPIYAIGEHDGAPFYSMKFAEGGTLSARIKKYRDKPREAAALIAKLAGAVAYAHAHGILHRDLKPGNVLFDAAGKPYVSDFGLAKWVARECDLTQTIAILGTPFYMAPEQATNSRAVTAAADIYSLGAILYHLLTGRPPASGETPMEVLHRASVGTPTRPRLTNRHIPRDLETICLKCLEKEPAARYSSAATLAEDLDRFCRGRTICARPVGLTDQAWRWTRRNPVLAGLGGISLTLLTVLCTILASNGEAWRSARSTKSVAVLPFETLGATQPGELFASGLQDDILVSLSKIADLKVIARNSVLQYRGREPDLRDTGRALGVNAVLHGSVRQDGTRARVNVRLVRVADGVEIWADNFDREISDVFAIQSDLALQVASALKATVLPAEANGIRRRPTHDSEAYLLYVQANDLFADIEKPRPKLEKAEQLLQQAIGRDSRFALAFAQLSQVETILADMYDPTPGRLEKARAWAEQALRLEPDLPEAHIATGRYLWQGQGHTGESDLAGALREFETARRGLPGHAEIHTLLGRVQRQLGKWDEAVASLEKAAALDPNTPDCWDRLYGTNLWLRRYPAALRAIEREIALMPNSWRCEFLRAWLSLQWKGDTSALEHLRDQPAADRDLYAELWIDTQILLRHLDKAEAIVRDDSREMIPGWPAQPKSLFLATIYSVRNDDAKANQYFEDALPLIQRAVEESPSDAARHMTLASVYAGLHRKEDAIREGKHACELLPEAKDALNGVDLIEMMAEIYLRVNEPDLALRLLDHALSVPAGPHVGKLRVSPTWEPLWNDPRFQRLLAAHEPRD